MTETLQLGPGLTLVQTTKLISYDPSTPHPGHTPGPHRDTLWLPEGTAVVEHGYSETHAAVVCNTLPHMEGNSVAGNGIVAMPGKWTGATLTTTQLLRKAPGATTWEAIGKPGEHSSWTNPYIDSAADTGAVFSCQDTAQPGGIVANSSNQITITAGTAPTPTPVPPAPGTDAPSLPPGIGYTIGKRLDPGDTVMLDPKHWAISAAHKEGNGLAVTNTEALAKYGQSYYGGPTDNFLHCSTGNGIGLWMVGDTLPSSGKYYVEFARRAGGPDAYHAWGWGSGWILGANGQELDIEEDVNWGNGEQGYGSCTYRSSLGVVADSYYNNQFPLADGKAHRNGVIWDIVNKKWHLIWDGVRVHGPVAMAHPEVPMQLQIMTGYTAGTKPPVWNALSDNIYESIRYYEVV